MILNENNSLSETFANNTLICVLNLKNYEWMYKKYEILNKNLKRQFLNLK
jgi:hypothetical protein